MSQAPFKRVAILGSPNFKGIYQSIQPPNIHPPHIYQLPSNFVPPYPNYQNQPTYHHGNNNYYQRYGYQDQYYPQPTQPPSLQTMRSKLNLVGRRFYRNDAMRKTQYQQNFYRQNTFHNFEDPNRIEEKSKKSGLVEELENVFNSRDSNSSVMVEYTDIDDEKKLGIITGPVENVENFDSEKWNMLTSTGSTTIIDSRHLTFRWISDSNISKEDLSNLREKSSVLLSQIYLSTVERLWRKCLNNRKSVVLTCKDAAQFLFDLDSPDALYAAHCVLNKNSIYFRKGESIGEFECRSIREVEEMKKLRVRDIKDKLFILGMIKRFPQGQTEFQNLEMKTLQELKQLQPEKSNSVPKLEGYPDLLDELKLFALGRYPYEAQEVFYQRLLKPFGLGNNSEDALKLCVKLKIFETDNIFFLRSSVASGIPQTIESLGQQIRDNASSISDPDEKFRRDLKHLKVYAIDEYAETEEVDDAVSFEELENGNTIIYIHIADPTRYITFNGELDKYASTRASTVYLPEKKIPMLPKSLGVELLSLSPNKDNDVLTFSAKLDPEGNILEYSVFPAKVSNIQRLDYDEYDKKLANSKDNNEILKDLRSLMKIGDARLALRLKNGASEFVMPSPEVRVRDGKVSVQPSKEFKSYTRRMVREMMILANEISAMFANKTNITIPYRGTMGGMYEEPIYTLDDLKIDTNISEEEYIKKMLEINKWAPRRRAAKKCLTKLPCIHSGLGVPMYTQVTSPIRRYSDLLIHHQLKAKIRGEPEPMDWNKMEQLMMSVEPNLTMNLNLQRDSERFWICKFFLNNKDNIFKAIVVRDSKNSYNVDAYEVTVYILENGFATNVKLENSASCGDILSLRVVDANPYKDILIFESV